MKQLFKACLIMVSVATILFMVNFISLSVFHKGLAYTWNIKGSVVVDSSYYGNQYYQVNDSIRVVAVKGCSIEYDKFFVYMLNNKKWVSTSAWTYKTTHNNMYGVLHFLRSQYNDYLNGKRYTKDELIWEYTQ